MTCFLSSIFAAEIPYFNKSKYLNKTKYGDCICLSSHSLFILNLINYSNYLLGI